MQGVDQDTQAERNGKPDFWIVDEPIRSRNRTRPIRRWLLGSTHCHAYARSHSANVDFLRVSTVIGSCSRSCAGGGRY